MKKIRFKGPNGLRTISPAQFEHEGVVDHGYEADSEGLVLNTLNGGVGFAADSRERVIEVSDGVAALLVAREPEQWEDVPDEEAQEIDQADADAAQAEADRLAAIEAEKAEIEDNRIRAEEEAAAREAADNHGFGNGDNE